MKKIITFLLLLGFLSHSKIVWAQPEPVEATNVKDDFQSAYFESLKQKAIENYDKAIIELEKCLKLQPENPNVFFELGKNYLAQKDYKKGYDAFEKATQIDPSNRWFWVGLYDVCYETKDYNRSIAIVEKLITFKFDYKEDLASLYMKTKQFDKALALINELNAKVGRSDKRDLYKVDILQDAKFQNIEKNNLLEQIKANPNVEANYLDLIFLYSHNNQEDQALEIAKKLEKAIPNSDWAQVSLFKFHLDANEPEKAIKAMNVVLGSKKIDDKVRHRIFNEFLIFVKNNPKFNPDLEKAIGYFRNDSNVNVAKEVGKFYQNQKDWTSAIQYYELYFKNSAPDDSETMLLLFQCYTGKGVFDVLASKAEKAIELYPTEPNYYYFAGLANNQLMKFKKAKDFLESGLDYVVNDNALAINFNIQLGEAYNGLGDMKKKELYFTKAEQLLKQK